MSEESLLLIRELKGKVQLIFDEYEKLEKKIEELWGEISSLNEKMEIIKSEKENLAKKYENLKLARIIESGYGDNRAATLKINKLLREIDKCVALLND